MKSAFRVTLITLILACHLTTLALAQSDRWSQYQQQQQQRQRAEAQRQAEQRQRDEAAYHQQQRRMEEQRQAQARNLEIERRNTETNRFMEQQRLRQEEQRRTLERTQYGQQRRARQQEQTYEDGGRRRQAFSDQQNALQMDEGATAPIRAATRRPVDQTIPPSREPRRNSESGLLPKRNRSLPESQKRDDENVRDAAYYQQLMRQLDEIEARLKTNEKGSKRDSR